MSIRPIAPPTCPRCGAEKTMVVDQGGLSCRLCGYRQGEAVTPKAETPAPERPAWRASYSINHRGPVNNWAQAVYRTAQDHIRQQKWQDALHSFYRALEYQRDFTDAHLWIARLSDDPEIKRQHLSEVLARQPDHMEAVREMMVLNGRLTPEEAARTHHFDSAEVHQVEVPIMAETTALDCPVCGGDLTEHEGTVRCSFCGYTDARAGAKRAGEESLTMALLERKANPVTWVIGRRLLHCKNCAADRTISGHKLSDRCPFCGSNQVIEKDALSSFQQPDGVVPFKISQALAGEAIKEKLGGMGERIRGWFDSNKVERATLSGVYLPFWLFDVMVDVTRTTIDRRTGQGRISSSVSPTNRTTSADMRSDVPICAVASPPPEITSKLGKFDLKQGRGYDAKLLAKYPAELYSIDFDKASLEARSVVGKIMRQRHKGYVPDDVEVYVTTLVRHMDFQLLLLPVWVATLIEEDGDVRIGLVNGQTGEVSLGKAQKVDG